MLNSIYSFLRSSVLRDLCVSSVLLLPSQMLHGQVPSPTASSNQGRGWELVKALPLQAKVHITTDHGGKSCRVFSVTDDVFTCAKGKGEGEKVSRSEIVRVKLAHYGRSALVGAGIGGGIGGVAGAIAGREKSCPTGQNFCLNGIGIGPGGVAAILGVSGALIGGAVGVLADFTQGGSIYTRP